QVLGSDGDAERVRFLAAHGQRPDALAKAVASVGTLSMLVIDDCHHAAGSPDAERFLSELIDLTSFRVLITSRVRPDWIASRMIVYGEAALIEVADLAFTDDEARQVIQFDEGLFDRARGWPAVIGLAAQRKGHGTKAALPQ